MGIFSGKKKNDNKEGKKEDSLKKEERVLAVKESAPENISKKGKKERKEVQKEIKLESLQGILAERKLAKPLVSEKTNLMASCGKYAFKIFKDSSKGAVKSAVESLYGVKVLKVNIINIPGKPKRARGGRTVCRSNIKKAIITLRSGEKIESF